MPQPNYYTSYGQQMGLGSGPPGYGQIAPQMPFGLQSFLGQGVPFRIDPSFNLSGEYGPGGEKGFSFTQRPGSPASPALLGAVGRDTDLLQGRMDEHSAQMQQAAGGIMDWTNMLPSLLFGMAAPQADFLNQLAGQYAGNADQTAVDVRGRVEGTDQAYQEGEAGVEEQMAQQALLEQEAIAQAEESHARYMESIENFRNFSNEEAATVAQMAGRNALNERQKLRSQYGQAGQAIPDAVLAAQEFESDMRWKDQSSAILSQIRPDMEKFIMQMEGQAANLGLAVSQVKGQAAAGAAGRAQLREQRAATGAQISTAGTGAIIEAEKVRSATSQIGASLAQFSAQLMGQVVPLAIAQMGLDGRNSAATFMQNNPFHVASWGNALGFAMASGPGPTFQSQPWGPAYAPTRRNTQGGSDYPVANRPPAIMGLGESSRAGSKPMEAV